MLEVIFSLNTLWWLILCLYIPACFALIIIVLLQKGKGQGLAGAFGMGGGMDTIFGPRSSKSLPQKITYFAAGLFMALALIMSILSGKVGRSEAPELIAEPPESAMSSLFDEDSTGALSTQPASPESATPAEVTETPVQDSTPVSASESVTPVEVTETPVQDSTPVSESELITPVEVNETPVQDNAPSPQSEVAPTTPAEPVEETDAGETNAESGSDSPAE